MGASNCKITNKTDKAIVVITFNASDHVYNSFLNEYEVAPGETKEVDEKKPHPLCSETSIKHLLDEKTDADHPNAGPVKACGNWRKLCVSWVPNGTQVEVVPAAGNAPEGYNHYFEGNVFANFRNKEGTPAVIKNERKNYRVNIGARGLMTTGQNVGLVAFYIGTMLGGIGHAAS